MTTRTWIGGAPGAARWGNAPDWSDDTVPSGTDTAILGAGAVVTIGPLGSVFGTNISLTDPTARLIVNTSLQNSTVVLTSGQLEGTGILQDDTIDGTLATNAVLLDGSLVLDPTPGKPGLTVTGAGSTITAAGPATISGGVAVIGSPVAADPTLISSQNGQLSLNLTVDVTGAVVMTGAGAGSAANTVTSVATINIAPGGDLVLQGLATAVGPIHIAGGTLDLSSYAGGVLPGVATFDDSGGKLILKSGAAAVIQGFRAGDTIDITGFTDTGTLAAGSDGFTRIGTVSLEFIGQNTSGARYIAAADGNGGTLVTTDAEPVAAVAFSDQTTGASGSHGLDAASGGPSYLQWQYVDDSADTVAITASVANVFIKGDGGTKAIAVTSGQNVLDGGTGSAFLTGGSGTDTFFLDPGSAQSTWDTLINFHAGDSVTIWNWVPGASTETVTAQSGAAGFQGATLGIANGQGGPVSNITFAGLSAARVAQMQTSTGTAAGLSYLHITA
jgi:hypothetical protein